jgi:2-methylcitrate dehydratase PrpD
MQKATAALADLIVQTRFEDLPPEVVWEAKRRIADVIGAGLAGSRTSVGTRITGFAAGMGKSDECVIWGSGKRGSPAHAALANGTMTFHLELDDVHRTSNTHPGVTTIPAALALAEARRLHGKDLLLSAVLGYEAQIRVGFAVSPSIFVDRTFLPPGTLGIFGAAAASAKLLGLDAEATAGALGTASYIGPLAPFESFRLGAPSKDTIMGWANHAGLHAAELAAHGFGGPGSALEGDYGFCKTVSQRGDMDRMFRGLGQSFEILRTGLKPYACCRQHHSAIDAVLELKELHGLKPDQVERIRHRTFVVGSRGSDTRPKSVQAAKYSAPYTIAVALALGRNERAQYSMEMIQDPALLALASKVDVSADAELDALYNEKWPSIVEVTLKDGRVLTSRRDLPKGEPEHPLSDAELKEKFLSLASDCVSIDRAEAIWDAIFKLDEMPDVSALAKLLEA